MRRRGPDRKPRQVHRLALLRTLLAGRKEGDQVVTGVEDLAIGYRKLLHAEPLPNTGGFLEVAKLVKKTFDDAPDSGSGRTTRFIFASEVEAEMKNGGTLKPGEQRIPGAPKSPLVDESTGQPLEELEDHPHDGEACRRRSRHVAGS